jgi:hypothetical protein
VTIPCLVLPATPISGQRSWSLGPVIARHKSGHLILVFWSRNFLCQCMLISVNHFRSKGQGYIFDSQWFHLKAHYASEMAKFFILFSCLLHVPDISTSSASPFSNKFSQDYPRKCALYCQTLGLPHGQSLFSIAVVTMVKVFL